MRPRDRSEQVCRRPATYLSAKPGAESRVSGYVGEVKGSRQVKVEGWENRLNGGTVMHIWRGMYESTAVE